MKIIALFFILTLIILCGCGPGNSDACDGKKILRISASGKINSLDPVYASDYVSAQMVDSFYDTLLQYGYKDRPYKLIPSMLEKMPLVSKNMTEYTFKLRDDLFFKSDPCFGKDGATGKGRKITSEDVKFSFLRIADTRNNSPGFWLLRGKIKGISEFRNRTDSAGKGDFAPYDEPLSGFEIISERVFKIKLRHPDPRFLYVLAMPYSSVVPREAVKCYGEAFSEHPVGSGPFILEKWIRDYSITLRKFDFYRGELFPGAEKPEDRARPLPLVDRIICYLVKQPLSAWLLFLQGELDMSALDKDNFDAVVGMDMNLVPALRERGIRMLQVPEFQVNYVGFCFSDPLLASNPNLRKAISCAYNTAARVKHFNNRLIPANGPIPPGVAGYDDEFKNPYSDYDIKRAGRYLQKAGFKDGIDPSSGKHLEFSFDLMGTSPKHRQLAELMVRDMRKIGIKIRPVLNNKPRFLQKSRKGQLQLFRLGWVGDYPDAENFLQLFYSKNAGGSNRAFFSDKKYDRMFEKALLMPDSPERTKLYKKMSKYLVGKCPWIFESYPIAFKLVHSWIGNYIPHDFVFSKWKYLSVDSKARRKAREVFKPLEFKDLRN